MTTQEMPWDKREHHTLLVEHFLDTYLVGIKTVLWHHSRDEQDLVETLEKLLRVLWNDTIPTFVLHPNVSEDSMWAIDEDLLQYVDFKLIVANIEHDFRSIKRDLAFHLDDYYLL